MLLLKVKQENIEIFYNEETYKINFIFKLVYKDFETKNFSLNASK